MKRVFSLIFVAAGLALLVVVAGSTAPSSTAAEGEHPGQAAFMAQKCNMCHTVPSVGIEAKVKSEKMKGPDLTAETAGRDAAELEKYLRREGKINDNEHKKEFKGTDAEMKAIIGWLGELK